MSNSVEMTKSIGGKIPTELFWHFKQTYAERHESATEALTHAIQLYIDAVPSTDTRNEVK